jgi:phytol kinase
LETLFVANQATKLLVLYLIQFGCGLLVVHQSIKVNYTRKIIHFCLFLIPLYLDKVFAYERSLGLFMMASAFSVITLIIYIEPMRKRVPFINMMFTAFDRPEDRPYTLLWLSTQIVAGYLVIIPFVMLYAAYGLIPLVLIPVLITAIGDGLAEPVGVRFGRHKYQVKALFTEKKYYRTLEGSACVFIAGLLIVAAHHALFTPVQFIAAMVIIPPAMTLAEAFSPHTWDTPALFLVGYGILFGVMMI